MEDIDIMKILDNTSSSRLELSLEFDRSRQRTIWHNLLWIMLEMEWNVPVQI